MCTIRVLLVFAVERIFVISLFFVLFICTHNLLIENNTNNQKLYMLTRYMLGLYILPPVPYFPHLELGAGAAPR